ncbi:hypothetical protein GT348_07190 [Aristophania vespae]|uniref:DUF1311 domain-containing protein n=1 Tax=Aristophania vespae TaxID=2697033 RepID=A0A6P1NGL8_9PROT|nr:hypothetical protein [Aristophania vespae]QHI96047.1 hypothetical protein GT348_07190 [Aristophania vespae]
MSKLMKTMLGAIALTYCVSAHAKPFTNQDAVAEAKKYKFVCGEDDKLKCRADRKQFIKEYQNAYAGDFFAQKNVAKTIWKHRDGQDLNSQIGACAWETIVVRTDTIYKNGIEIYDQKDMCSHLSGDDKPPQSYAPADVVEKKIEEIKKNIQARTVHLVNVEEMDFDVKRDHEESHAGVGWSDKY